MFVLLNKPLAMKKELKKMRNTLTPLEIMLVEAKRDHLNTLVALEKNPLDTICLLNAKEASNKYQNLTSMEWSRVSQWAKTHWLINVNDNFKLLYSSVTEWKNVNVIREINTSNVIINDIHLITIEFCSYYSNLFQIKHTFSPNFDIPAGTTITHSQAEELMDVVSNKEILFSLHAINISKTLGAKGFIFKFFINYWDIVGKQVLLPVH